MTDLIRGSGGSISSISSGLLRAHFEGLCISPLLSGRCLDLGNMAGENWVSDVKLPDARAQREQEMPQTGKGTCSCVQGEAKYIYLCQGSTDCEGGHQGNKGKARAPTQSGKGGGRGSPRGFRGEQRADTFGSSIGNSAAVPAEPPLSLKPPRRV